MPSLESTIASAFQAVVAPTRSLRSCSRHSNGAGDATPEAETTAKVTLELLGDSFSDQAGEGLKGAAVMRTKHNWRYAGMLGDQRCYRSIYIRSGSHSLQSYFWWPAAQMLRFCYLQTYLLPGARMALLEQPGLDFPMCKS